ncbi:pyridoxamine 5'-phosphate oxidase-domain-containing protein [Xylariales sp. AK1849]|nr:pyridoxamine 5'-phosphate oxidase-domain-containing protein [Xylariales sp. AK1849]
MKPSLSLPLISCARICTAEVTPAPPQHIFSNPSEFQPTYKIPTAYESAVLGRRILALTPLATLSTVFPASSSSSSQYDALENRPNGLGGIPVGLPDYIADCEPSGNPTILAINIATSFKNVAAGSNISLSIQWAPPYPPDKRIKSSSFLSRLISLFRNENIERQTKAYDPLPYSAANLPRFSLVGYLETIPLTQISPSLPEITSCFVRTHPDSKYWLPGNPIHSSEFVRLVVTAVYWIGGFGDRAYIGWIDVEDWLNVTREEWEDVRLPGEKKGWDEWSVAAGDWVGEEI